MEIRGIAARSRTFTSAWLWGELDRTFVLAHIGFPDHRQTHRLPWEASATRILIENAAQQRVVREKLEGSSATEHPLTRKFWFMFREEVE